MSKNLFEDSSFPDVLEYVLTEMAIRRDIRKILEARFGVLDEPMAQALDSAEREALDALVVPSATESLEQIRARLGLGGHAS